MHFFNKTKILFLKTQLLYQLKYKLKGLRSTKISDGKKYLLQAAIARIQS